MQPSKINRFVAGYLVTSWFKRVAANLLIFLWRKNNRNWLWLRMVVRCDACMSVHMHGSENESPHYGQLQGMFSWQEGETEKADVRDKRPPCTVGHSLTFLCFHFSITPFFFLSPPPLPSCSISISSQAGFGLTMASWDWEAATMIGGLFIYNHKGEVLISRVYRDDIGYVSQGVKLLQTLLKKFFWGGDRWTGWDWLRKDGRGLYPSSTAKTFPCVCFVISSTLCLEK